MYTDFIKTSLVSIDYKLGDINNTTSLIIDAINNHKKSHLLVFNELTLTSCSMFNLNAHLDYVKDAISSLEKILNVTKESDAIIVIGLPLNHLNKVYNAMLVLYKGKIMGGRVKEDASFELELFGNKINLSSDNLYYTDTFSFELLFEEDLYSNYQYKDSDLVVCVSSFATLIDEDKTSLLKETSRRLHKGIVFVGASSKESTSDGAYIDFKLAIDHLGNKEFNHDFTMDANLNIASIKYNNKFKGKKGFNIYINQTLLFVNKVKVNKTPFKVNDPLEVINLQKNALNKRLLAIHSNDVVLGFSGGLDSTLALLVLKELKKVRPLNIHCLILPCFATSNQTMANALNLCDALDVPYKIIDISRTTESHLLDLGHDLKSYDVTFENAQARERTQVLFDLANKVNGIVVGTGDLSEIALGFATFNGDHISNYNVNGGVPKTLIKDIVYAYSKKYHIDALIDILNTPISPELIPSKNKTIVQSTEDIVGPYELIDFIIYYYLISGNSIHDIYYLAKEAFKDIKDLKKYYKGFFTRFFRNQFKRNCSSDGLKIFTLGFSSRGEFKLASDLEINSYLSFIDGLEE